MQSWRSYLDESEEELKFDKHLENTFRKILNIFGPQMKDTADQAAEQADDQQTVELDEGILFGLGVTLAAPAIVKIFTGIAKVFGNSIQGWTGSDPGINRVADKIIKMADEAHHLFQKPIKYFVTKVLRIKDKDKVDQATGILYNLLVGFLMIYSGVGAAKAVEAGKTTLAGFEGALAAIKGGEVTAFIKNSLSRVAGVE